MLQLQLKKQCCIKAWSLKLKIGQKKIIRQKDELFTNLFEYKNY